MPLSVFEGESTEELHEHYDPDDNPTGTTVVTRPGWSEDNRAWALGLALHEEHQCPRGHDLAESSSDEWNWVPLDAITCLACAALNSAADRDKDNPLRRANLYAVKKVPRPKRRR